MCIRLLCRLSILLSSAVLLLAAPVAHAAPPKGDMLAAPVQISVNSSKTVKKVHNATEESADDLAMCHGTSQDTIWFTFVAPWDMTVDFYSDGSVLVSDVTVAFPFIAVFENQPLSLSMIACGSLGENLHNVELSAGEYRVLMGHTSTFSTMGPGSQYKLAIRAQRIDLAQNSSFDDPIADGTWKIKKAGNPPKITQLFPGGDGKMRFDGVAKGRILQQVSIPPASQFKFVNGDFIDLIVYASTTPPAGSDVKATIAVAYSDGTPKTSVTRTFHIVNTATSGWFLYHALAEIRSPAVSSITLSVTSPKAADTFTLDFLPVSVYNATTRREALPPPSS